MTKDKQNQEGKEDIEEKELMGCEDCPHKVMSNPPESRGDWSDKLRNRFEYMVNLGIEDGLWTEGERAAFMFVCKNIARDFSEELKRRETLAHTEGIEEGRKKTLEELKLWRPYFYRDKITDEDIKELLNKHEDCTIEIARSIARSTSKRGIVECPIHGHHNPYDMWKKGETKETKNNETI